MTSDKKSFDEKTNITLGENIPSHVAIIMDGNGRWAKQRGQPRIFGHKRGAESVEKIVETAGEIGVKALTLYAFSEENWGRPPAEVNAIMGLLNSYIVGKRDELNRKNVQFRTIGNIQRLPEKSRELVEETTKMLSTNTGLILTIALSYGSRSEILDAVRKIAGLIQEKEITPLEIDQRFFSQFLNTKDLPELDLLIRTSGEQRLSNFLLWQSAYTELYFTDVYWPDFDRQRFLEAIMAFQQRQRRFGLLDKSPDNSTLDVGDGKESLKGDAAC